MLSTPECFEVTTESVEVNKRARRMFLRWFYQIKSFCCRKTAKSERLLGWERGNCQTPASFEMRLFLEEIGAEQMRTLRRCTHVPAWEENVLAFEHQRYRERKAGRTFERESDIMSCFEFVRKHPEISEGHVYDKETDSKKCMDNSILQNT